MKKLTLYDPYVGFEFSVLPNGLSVYSLYRNRPWLKAGFVIHSGGRMDLEGKAGTAHFVEHLVSENVEDLSMNEIRDFFEDTGGGSSLGSTSMNSTKYTFSVPLEREILNKAVSIFGSMLLNGRPEKLIEKERQTILREFAEKYLINRVYELDWVMKNSQIFGGLHMANYPGLLGNPATIDAITKEDLVTFYEKHYTPRNMSVVAVGGLKHEQVVKLFQQSIFGEQRGGFRNPPVMPCQTLNFPEKPEHAYKLSDYIGDNNVGNIALHTSCVGIPKIFDREVIETYIKMLNRILYEEIREKMRSSYNFASGLTDWGDVFEFGIGSKISPEISDSIGLTIQQCLWKVLDNRDLFNKKKMASIKDLYMWDRSDGGIRDAAMGDLVDCNHIEAIYEDLLRLEAVEFEDVCQLAAYILPKEHRFTAYSYL